MESTVQVREVHSISRKKNDKITCRNKAKREDEEFPAIIHSTLLLSQIRLPTEGSVTDSSSMCS